MVSIPTLRVLGVVPAVLSSVNQGALLLAFQWRDAVPQPGVAVMLTFLASGAGWRYADEKSSIAGLAKRVQGGVIVMLITTCCGLLKTIPSPTTLWAVKVNVPVYVPGSKLRLTTAT